MTDAFLNPRSWSADELDADISYAIELFRSVRFDEPLEIYTDLFEEFLGGYEDLAELSIDLTRLRENACEIVSNTQLLRALRFLCGPPISIDDLKTIAETSLAPTKIRQDAEGAERVVDAVLSVHDRHRFPWLSDGREPQLCEKEAAATATAALMASEEIRTLRRNEAKALQEALVAKALREGGFEEVASPRKILFLEDAPGPGQFCRERTLGTRKADLVVGLWDRRRMPIECKVSNSTVNSIKRINNDAAVKATTWLDEFGHDKVVPVAVLTGVFKRANLENAQARGLTLVWAHRLDDLLGWIARTRPS